jgi:integrase
MRDRQHLVSAEVEKLMEAARGSRNTACDRCLLLLMFRHGLRVSEACQSAPRQTLLGKSRQSISHARRVSVSRGMHALALAFKPRLQDRFSARL